MKQTSLDGSEIAGFTPYEKVAIRIFLFVPISILVAHSNFFHMTPAIFVLDYPGDAGCSFYAGEGFALNSFRLLFGSKMKISRAQSEWTLQYFTRCPCA